MRGLFFGKTYGKGWLSGSKLRFAAVFSVVSILLNAVCYAASGNGYLIAAPGGDESGAMIFDGMADFATSNQSEGCWKYQYALDCDSPLWQELDIYSGGDGYWYSSECKRGLGLSSGARIRISNKTDGLPLNAKPSVCWAFYVPETGTVSLDSNTASNYGTVEGYYGMVRITLNGVNVSPENGWISLDGKAAAFSGVSVRASAGDVIRFEVTSNKYVASGDGIHILWNPGLVLMPDSARYTENEGVLSGLTAFMRGFFGGKSAETMDSSAADALSSAKQNAKNSKYGVYSAFDSVYSGGIIPSDEASVWKYAVLKEVCGENGVSSDSEIGLNAEYSENKLNLSWDKILTSGVYSVEVADSSGSVQYFTTADNSLSLTAPSDGYERFIRIKTLSSSSLYSVSVSGGSADCETVDTSETVCYLNEQRVENKGKISEAYELSGSGCLSKYKFFTSLGNASSAADAIRGRTVVFSSGGENMMFGFTAPYEGEYEFSAPISSDGTVRYSLIKETADGVRTSVLQEKTINAGRDNFISAVRLLKGETLWLTAFAAADTDINIGIPRAALTEKLSEDEKTVYKHRAVDYFESGYSNGRKYNNYSTADNTAGVWSFGYFNNPVEKTAEQTNYDTLGIGDYVKGDNASALMNVLKPYELIRSGKIYNSLTVSQTAAGDIRTGESGTVGVMYPALGSAYADRSKLGLPYKSKGIFATFGYGKNTDRTEEIKKSYNIGVYMRYTAPLCGNAVLRLNDTADRTVAGDKMLLVKGNTVEEIYTGSIATGTAYDLGYLNAGDTVTLCYSKITGNLVIGNIGAPVIELSDSWKTVSFDNTGIGNAALTASATHTIRLPRANRHIGYKFIGWRGNVSGEISGCQTVAGENTAYSAEYTLYGDIDGNGAIEADDLKCLRDRIVSECNAARDNADVNVDGRIDILDLVRMKKWLSGVPAALGK